MRGSVEVISEQREQELVETRAIAVASMDATHAVETTYLAETSAGHVLSALGKSGEPRAQRPMTIGIVHRLVADRDDVGARDRRGRARRARPDAGRRSRSRPTLGDAKQIWPLYDGEVNGRYHAARRRAT